MNETGIKLLSPLARIVADPRVQAALVKAKEEQSTYAAKLVELAPHLDPMGKAKTLQSRIATAKSADEIGEASAELSSLMTESARLANQRAVQLGRQSFLVLKAKVVELFVVAESVVKEIAIEVEHAEADFFKTYGAQRQATALSHQVSAVETHLKTRHEALTRNVALPGIIAINQAPPREGLAADIAYFENP